MTKRLAEAWLDDVLAQARRAELPGMVRTGATVADAAAEWLRCVEHDRAGKPSTLTDYRHTAERLVRDLGSLRLEDVTAAAIECWKGTLGVEPDGREVPRDPPRDLQARDEGVGSTAQPAR